MEWNVLNLQMTWNVVEIELIQNWGFFTKWDEFAIEFNRIQIETG